MTLIVYSTLLLTASSSLILVKKELPYIIKLWNIAYNKFLKEFLSWKFFLCFFIAWMITNGYIYIIIGLGIILKSKILSTIGWSILALYWMPFFVEKPVTLAIAVWLNKIIFVRRDNKKNKHIDIDKLK